MIYKFIETASLKITFEWKRRCLNIFKDHKFSEWKEIREKLPNKVISIDGERRCLRCGYKDTYGGADYSEV